MGFENTGAGMGFELRSRRLFCQREREIERATSSGGAEIPGRVGAGWGGQHQGTTGYTRGLAARWSRTREHVVAGSKMVLNRFHNYHECPVAGGFGGKMVSYMEIIRR